MRKFFVCSLTLLMLVGCTPRLIINTTHSLSVIERPRPFFHYFIISPSDPLSAIPPAAP